MLPYQELLHLNEYDLYWDVKVDDNNNIISNPFLQNIYVGYEIDYSQELADIFIDKLINTNSEQYVKIIIDDDIYISHSIALLETVDEFNCKYINFDEYNVACYPGSELYKSCIFTYEHAQPSIVRV